MAQISRTYKSEISILVRVCYNCYNNHQRREYSHYDVLRISQNATQKQIKDAYIKLSKETHPDCGKTGTHADFVKINEAYNVLSKKRSKELYDMNLNNDNIYTVRTRQDQGFNNSFNQWERYNTGYRTHPQEVSIENKRKAIQFCVLIIILGMFIQIYIKKRFLEFHNKMSLENHRKAQFEYLKAVKEGELNTIEKKLQLISKLRQKYSIDPTEK